MAGPPKRLFIPGKTNPNAHQPGYGDDMRQIEIFNPINKIIAGSGVTLSPVDGSGPQVEISASGGGGVGEFVLNTGPDLNDFVTNPPFGLALGPLNQLINLYDSRWFVTSNSSGSEHVYSFVSSWVWFVAAGDSIVLLPIITSPAFTGVATLNYDIIISALALDQSDNAVYAAELLTIAPSTSHQTTAAEFSTVLNPGGGTIVLTAGTGTHGNGLVSTPGNTYFGSANVTMRVPTGVSF